MADSNHAHNHHPGPIDSQGQADMSITETNRRHWDSFAPHYSAHQWQRDVINKITAFILHNITWLGVPFLSPASTFESTTHQSIRVLDYACGPGTITNALSSHAIEYLGIDLSEGMVDAYNTRFQPPPSSSVVNPDGSVKQEFTAHAVVGNLLNDPVPDSIAGVEYFNFDLAVVGLGFHHFDDVQLATTRLAQRLKPGGVLMIVDFLTHEPEEGGSMRLISHHGFSEERIKELFGNAGLVDVGIMVNQENWRIKESERRAFIARGRKPADRPGKAEL